MVPVPKEFQPLLPSSPVENLEAKRDKQYIIENFLRLSTLDGWKWMLQTYSKAELADVIRKATTLRPKDLMLWIYWLKIDPKEVKCLTDDFTMMRRKFWPY